MELGETWRRQAARGGEVGRSGLEEAKFQAVGWPMGRWLVEMCAGAMTWVVPEG